MTTPHQAVGYLCYQESHQCSSMTLGSIVENTLLDTSLDIFGRKKSCTDHFADILLDSLGKQEG